MEQLQPPAQWSIAVDEANWIAERLGPFGGGVTSVVPAGFEAYARVLHPAEDPGHGHRLIRWHEVAAWSGIPLRPDAQFYTVALPADRPEAPAPWSGQGPHQGSLYAPDAEVLAEVLRGFTTTPEECFFCVWDGCGWGGTPFSTSGTPPICRDVAVAMRQAATGESIPVVRAPPSPGSREHPTRSQLVRAERGIPMGSGHCPVSQPQGRPNPQRGEDDPKSECRRPKSIRNPGHMTDPPLVVSHNWPDTGNARPRKGADVGQVGL